MAHRLVNLILIGALAVFGFSRHVAAEYAAGVIHVTGKVVCQDCSLSYTKWVDGSRPIKGSRVSVACMDVRRRVIHFGSDKTDEKGEFDLIVEKVINGKPLNPKLCTVRLVSSPDRSCDIPTDFGNGQTGTKLVRPFSVYRDSVKYVVGPFYYTTPMCEKPDTDESGSNY